MRASTEEILEQVTRLQALLHRDQTQHFRKFGPWSNPQRGQGRVLSILKMKPQISQKELTYLLDMSKQSLAELLNKLEKNGYIKREPSLEDRRSFNIILTQEGASMSGEMNDMQLEREQLFNDFTDEELAQFSDYLQRVIERLEKQSAVDDEEMRKQMMERFLSRPPFDRRPFDRSPFPGFEGRRNRRPHEHD
jgi:DNA-binding MarR family transcriptional regulator